MSAFWQRLSVLERSLPTAYFKNQPRARRVNRATLTMYKERFPKYILRRAVAIWHDSDYYWDYWDLLDRYGYPYPEREVSNLLMALKEMGANTYTI